MSKKLTTQDYWETYYNKNYGNKEHIVAVCSYYDSLWNLLLNSNDSGKSIIEIGGFPGRYLAYLASKYNLVPTCLDYNSDSTQIEAAFNVMGVTDYQILKKDFTTFVSIEKYDFVISNGFIEHFNNFEHILDLHVSYLKYGGKMFVTIPNMRGYIKIYKYLVDYKNLKIHNLTCMRLGVFEKFADRHQLKIIKLTYFGGFPYNVHQPLNLIQKVIFKLHWLLFKKYLNKYVTKHPSKYFSSSIIAIFEKA